MHNLYEPVPVRRRLTVPGAAVQSFSLLRSIDLHEFAGKPSGQLLDSWP